MKITLILAAAPNDPLKKNDPFRPLSLPLLAASAPDHEYTFVDMLAGESVPYDLPTDLVGISVRLTAEKTAYAIAEEYKRRGVKIVMGGPHISSIPFRAAEHADAVVVGEGEPLWPVILSDLEVTKELKRFYVASPKKFEAESHTLFQINNYLDLEDVPIAIEERGLFKGKYVFDTVFAVRGCAMNCDFCSVSHLFGRKTRFRKISDVVKEIESFKGFYYLLDDTVFGRPHSYAFYLELYDAISGLDKTRLWTGQANLDAASSKEGREVIRRAAKSGLLYAAIGMESINPEVQKKSGTLGKMGIGEAEDTVKRMKENIAFIQDQGIAISGWFTIGYEEDNIDTFYKTLEFCKDTNIIPIISPLEALPGTRLFDRLMIEGRVDERKKINIIHHQMTDDDILNALRKVTKDGFSMGQIFKRTRFYQKKFRSVAGCRHERNRTLIEKTMFVFVLQNKLKKGVIGLANTE